MSSFRSSAQLSLRSLRSSVAARPTVAGHWRPSRFASTFAGRYAKSSVPWRALAVTGGFAAAWLLYSESYDLERWLPLAHADAPPSLADPVLEKSTGILFPRRISPTSTGSQSLSLVGVGVRTVSFLKVKVYGAGFYLDEGTLSRLNSVDGWQSFTADRLINPSKAEAGSLLTGEQLIEKLLSGSVECAIRIESRITVPSRNTDFSHLRDGFTRSLAARQKTAAKNSLITHADEERISKSIQQFKSFFPNSSLPKGKELLLVRTSSGSLAVEYEGKVLGKLDDAWVAQAMILAYFSEQNVISQALKEDVARGLEARAK